MAYARPGDQSNVYVLSTGLELLCMDCAIGPDFKAKTTAAMIEHLGDHRAAGQQVPEDALADLLADQDENDAQFARSD